MKISRLSYKQITTTVEKLLSEGLVNYNIKSNKVTIYRKATYRYLRQVKSLLESVNVPYFAYKLQDGPFRANILGEKTQQRTVLKVFVRGMHAAAGVDVRSQGAKTAPSAPREKSDSDFDLVVIGGGSGGIAAAVAAATLGPKVAVCDIVIPSPRGTTWGAGGTCVNVGCIPKTLMHRAALLGFDIREGPLFGWNVGADIPHDWGKLVEEIQNFVKTLNFSTRKRLSGNKVVYRNAFAEFETPHRLKVRNVKNKVSVVTAENFIVAVGGRPLYPNIPGAREYAITSDDIFSLGYNPGRTVVIGASYVALECAGFLAGFGQEVTVLVRSRLLSGFDQQMAEMIGEYMESQGVHFIRKCFPNLIEKIADGTPPLLKVHAVKGEKGEPFQIECNTVLFATGRRANTRNMGLENIGVKLNESNGKILVDEYERTSVPNIFAVGDVADGKPELASVAIKTGRLLSQRLYGNDYTKMDYTHIPTAVFTPLEYGCVGLSEERAIAEYGRKNVEVYHSHFNAIYYALSSRDESKPYLKIVCLKSEGNLIVGFHVLGPNAGEITQGFALGLKLGAKLKDLQNLVGIHPTCAEITTTLSIPKSSGKPVLKTFC